MKLANQFATLGILRLVCADECCIELQREFANVQVKPLRDAGQIFDHPEITAVAIAHEKRSDFMRQALERGKDVYFHNGFALTADEAEESIALATRQRLVLMLVNPIQMNRAFQKLRQLASVGAIGKIVFVQVDRLATVELADIHLEDVATATGLVKDKPVEVSCFLEDYSQSGCAHTGVSSVRFAGSQTAFVFASLAGNLNQCRVLAYDDENRTAVLRQFEGKPRLEIFDTKIRPELAAAVLEENVGALIELDSAEMQLQRLCRLFLNHLKLRAIPESTADTLLLLRVLGGCQRSRHLNGVPVTIESF